MVNRILVGGFAAALAGAAMLAISSAPASAFTLDVAVARKTGRGGRYQSRLVQRLGLRRLARRLAPRLGPGLGSGPVGLAPSPLRLEPLGPLGLLVVRRAPRR